MMVVSVPADSTTNPTQQIGAGQSRGGSRPGTAVKNDEKHMLFTAKTRVTVGQVSLLVSVLLMALFLGIVPDRASAVLEGRARLCELIAVNGSILVSREDSAGWETMLHALVNRNDEILTAAVRSHDGVLRHEVGAHAQNWKESRTDRSTETLVQVPVYDSQTTRWGTVEVVFSPVRAHGFTGFLQHPWTRLIGFVSATCFLFFSFHLRRVIRQLNSAKVIPQRVRSALDRLAEGLLMLDAQGRIVLANGTLAAWLGEKPEQLTGVAASRFPWCDVDGHPLQTFPWQQAIVDGQLQQGVIVKLRGHDYERILVVYASPVMGHDGKYGGVFASFEDVTELEEQQVELTTPRDEVEQANRARSKFLARMRHEICTPMNALLGYTDVLRHGFDETAEGQQDYLNTIHASGERLLALINDILDLSKIESGRLELKLARCSPFELIAHVVSMLRRKADEKAISLEFECAGELPDTILTDAVRLGQTITNLVANAIKFTERGGVRIVAQMVPPARPDETPAIDATTMLRIDVIDSGIGISQEALEKIFDPFAQADPSVGRHFGGSGLGLAISRQLAGALGGSIEVSSEVGVGSRFSLTVSVGPISGVQLVDATTATDQVENSEARSEFAHTLSAVHILVVDDGESNRKLMNLVLRLAGASVALAENGQEAVERVQRGDFDAVLMDMQMPVMDGYTATRKLRNLGYKLPILALTAQATPVDEEKCLDVGCSGFLTKPIAMHRLLKTLSEVLGNAPRTDGPATHKHMATQSEQPKTQPRLIGEQTATNIPQGPSKEPVKIRRLHSTLPTDDPEFRKIVEEYLARLRERMFDLEKALAQHDLDAVVEISHWLTGSAGTAGFDVFTEPARQMEQAAKAADVQLVATRLAQINRLVNAINLDSTHRGTAGPRSENTTSHMRDRTPLRSTLPPHDPVFQTAIKSFIGDLHEKLASMKCVLDDGGSESILQFALWLKGAGGTVGFDAFTEPAQRLYDAADHGKLQATRQDLSEIQGLASRVVEPEETIGSMNPPALTDAVQT